MGVEGVIKKSHVDEDGVTVIEDFELTGFSLVHSHQGSWFHGTKHEERTVAEAIRINEVRSVPTGELPSFAPQLVNKFYLEHADEQYGVASIENGVLTVYDGELVVGLNSFTLVGKAADGKTFFSAGVELPIEDLNVLVGRDN